MSKKDPAPHDGSTPNYYTNHGCRCDLCKNAWSKYCKERRVERGSELKDNPDKVTHGIPSTYGNHGCRCAPCTQSWSASTADRSRRRKERLEKESQDSAYETYSENIEGSLI